MCSPVLLDDYGDSRMVRTRSLSKISSSVARQQYVDTSDEDEYEYQRNTPMYSQPPQRRRNSRASSQENLGQAPPVRPPANQHAPHDRITQHRQEVELTSLEDKVYLCFVL